jgi:hypothetical protein
MKNVKYQVVKASKTSKSISWVDHGNPYEWYTEALGFVKGARGTLKGYWWSINNIVLSDSPGGSDGKPI